MLFSIITVCFNSAETIRDTFDSVLSQSCKDYEYLVIDGLSTDGTVDIIKEYEPKFEGRLRWISEKDKGIYDAMNKGIKMSQGEYLNFMNSDDFFEKEAFANLKQAMLATPGGDVYYGYNRLIIEPDWKEYLVERKSPLQLEKKRPMVHQACFFHKTCFDQIGLYDTQYRLAADYDHTLRLVKAEKRFIPVDHILVNFRLGGRSTINSGIYWQEQTQILANQGWIDRKQFEKDKLIAKIRKIVIAPNLCCFYGILKLISWIKRPFAKR